MGDGCPVYNGPGDPRRAVTPLPRLPLPASGIGARRRTPADLPSPDRRSCRHQTAVSADIERGKHGGPELPMLSRDRKRSQIAVRTPDLQLITMITVPELKRGAHEGHFPSSIFADWFRKTCITWSLVTESNRRPSPYHACRFRPTASRLGRITAGRRDCGRWLRRAMSAIAGGVVTWFVTGSETTSHRRRVHASADLDRLKCETPYRDCEADAAAPSGPLPLHRSPRSL